MKLDASQEEALLRSAEAEAQLARTDFERSRDLACKKVVSRPNWTLPNRNSDRLNAVVDQMRSSIAKKTLIAPFDGQLGIRQVNVGQMINAGQQVVPLTRLDSRLRRFRLAAAISWSVNAGPGGARDYGRPSRTCVQWEIDRN